MFAPDGYLPARQLWEEFVSTQIDAIYRDTATYFASDEFDPTRVRGSPLDIAEHFFLANLRDFGVYLASPSGVTVRVSPSFNDGEPDLFSFYTPARSAWIFMILETEVEDIEAESTRFAGRFFEPWWYQPDEREAWTEAYPPLKEGEVHLAKDKEASLRFHRLPVCLNRTTWTVVEEVPPWNKFLKNPSTVNGLIEAFGGHAICVRDPSTKGSRKAPKFRIPRIVPDHLMSSEQDLRQRGRPKKVDRAASAYRDLYPDGHSEPLKVVQAKVESVTRETIAESTLKRAIRKAQKDQKS